MNPAYKGTTKPIETSFYSSPIGLLRIKIMNDFIREIEFTDSTHMYANNETKQSPLVERIHKELDDYFQGKRTGFTIPFSQEGTLFQKECWDFLKTIPYGETRSYSDEAIGTGNPKRVRAVANSNHRNNIAIMIPCHRVIGKDGSLTGYGAGIWRKKWLLEHEQKFSS